MIPQQLWLFCSPGGPAEVALDRPQQALGGSLGPVPAAVGAPGSSNSGLVQCWTTGLKFGLGVWMPLLCASLLSVSIFS